MKKAIIALISLLIFCIVFPSTVSAESARSHYKPRLTAPTSDNAYYNSKLNRYSQTGYGMPNCVAYAYGRVYEMNGKAPKITHGNAGEWWSINKQGGYYKYGSKPKVGAVVVWSNHVPWWSRSTRTAALPFPSPTTAAPILTLRPSPTTPTITARLFTALSTPIRAVPRKRASQAVHRRQNRSNRTGRAGTGIPYTGDRRQQGSHAGDRAKR